MQRGDPAAERLGSDEAPALLGLEIVHGLGQVAAGYDGVLPRRLVRVLEIATLGVLFISTGLRRLDTPGLVGEDSRYVGDDAAHRAGKALALSHR